VVVGRPSRLSWPPWWTLVMHDVLRSGSQCVFEPSSFQVGFLKPTDKTQVTDQTSVVGGCAQMYTLRRVPVSVLCPRCARLGLGTPNKERVPRVMQRRIKFPGRL
jgi:hypothetical protein